MSAAVYHPHQVPCCVFKTHNTHRRLRDGSKVGSTDELCTYLEQLGQGGAEGDGGEVGGTEGDGGSGEEENGRDGSAATVGGGGGAASGGGAAGGGSAAAGGGGRAPQPERPVAPAGCHHAELSTLFFEGKNTVVYSSPSSGGGGAGAGMGPT